MTQKEKAIAYDNALKRAKEWEGNPAAVEYIFPELTESEDEKILKRIKTAVEQYWSDEPLKEILAWLEKQKPSNVNSLQSDWVDLGLPSGRKWATCNIGAKKEHESGKPFTFGDAVNLNLGDGCTHSH